MKNIKIKKLIMNISFNITIKNSCAHNDKENLIFIKNRCKSGSYTNRETTKVKKKA